MSSPKVSPLSIKKRRIPGKYIPQENPNWTQHTGPHDTSYEKDTDKRRKKRNERRNNIFSKARELVSIAGGRMFIRYVDGNGKPWVLATDKDEYDQYRTSGLSAICEGEQNCMPDDEAHCDYTSACHTAAHTTRQDIVAVSAEYVTSNTDSFMSQINGPIEHHDYASMAQEAPSGHGIGHIRSIAPTIKTEVLSLPTPKLDKNIQLHPVTEDEIYRVIMKDGKPVIPVPRKKPKYEK